MSKKKAKNKKKQKNVAEWTPEDLATHFERIMVKEFVKPLSNILALEAVKALYFSEIYGNPVGKIAEGRIQAERMARKLFGKKKKK